MYAIAAETPVPVFNVDIPPAVSLAVTGPSAAAAQLLGGQHLSLCKELYNKQ